MPHTRLPVCLTAVVRQAGSSCGCSRGGSSDAAEFVLILATMRRNAAAIVVVIAAVTSFAAALSNGPLGDERVLLEQRLADVATVGQLLSLLGESYWGELSGGGLYRPLTLLLLGAQRLSFGSDLARFGIVGLGMHTACSLLVLLLLQRLFSRLQAASPAAASGTGSGRAAALAGALLFALHPIHAEAVTTIYGQADMAASLFFVWALWLYLGSNRGPGLGTGLGTRPPRTPSAIERPGCDPGWPRLLAIGACYLLSLGFKEAGAALPAALALTRGLVLCPRCPGLRRWVGPSELFMLLPLGLFIGLRFAVLREDMFPSGTDSVAWDYPWWARINLVIVSLGSYLQLLVMPWAQTTYYGHLRDAVFGWPVLQAAWLVAGTALAWWLLQPNRLLSNSPPGEHGAPRASEPVVAARLGLGLLALALLPVANVLPIGIVVAERALYLPSIGFAMLAAAGWLALAQRLPRLAWGTALLVLLAAFGASQRVSTQWRTPLSHWQATVAAHPRSDLGNAMLGQHLLVTLAAELPVAHIRTDPRFAQAEQALQRALALTRGLPEALYGQAQVALVRGDMTRYQELRLEYARQRTDRKSKPP